MTINIVIVFEFLQVVISDMLDYFVLFCFHLKQAL